MARSPRYGKEIIALIQQRLDMIGYDNIAGIVELAAEINRGPFSLYSFVKRKFLIELLPDTVERIKFKDKYFEDFANYKNKSTRKLHVIDKIIKAQKIDEPAQKLIRPKAVYSNPDVNAWRH